MTGLAHHGKGNVPKLQPRGLPPDLDLGSIAASFSALMNAGIEERALASITAVPERAQISQSVHQRGIDLPARLGQDPGTDGSRHDRQARRTHQLGQRIDDRPFLGQIALNRMDMTPKVP